MKLAALRNQPWARLIRLDRPIGVYLLLWPMLWSIWLAGKGSPQFSNLVIFICGVVIMRAAGCIINDYADRNFDGLVERTKMRPIASGEIAPHQALKIFIALILLAFILVLQTNPLTVKLSFFGLALTVVYPFVKRWNHFPQVILGLAWAWVVPMCFAAERGSVPIESGAVFFAVLTWTVAFDSFYAMVDRAEDRHIGVKSTAVLWGDNELRYIAALQLLTVIFLAVCGSLFHLNWIYMLGLFFTTCLFVKQVWRARSRRPEDCFQAFLSNQWVGALIFGFLVLDIWVYPFGQS